MNILLTNQFLNSYTGSETWVMTMARELARQHTVHTLSLDGSDTLTGLPRFNPSTHYDLALINHHTCLTFLKDASIGKRIFTSHGILPDLEQPRPGADVYVAVSEEVQTNLLLKGYPSVIIRNPIDLEKFTYSEPNKTLENILVVSNYNGNLATIKEACQGYFLSCVGGNNNVKNIERYMEQADLVITLGRGCYEALACGKNVIIYDYNGGDGLVDENNIYDFRKNNCSGRFSKKQFTAEELRGLLEKYDPKRNLRPYIEKEHNVTYIVQNYLSL